MKSHIQKIAFAIFFQKSFSCPCRSKKSINFSAYDQYSREGQENCGKRMHDRSMLSAVNPTTANCECSCYEIVIRQPSVSWKREWDVPPDLTSAFGRRIRGRKAFENRKNIPQTKFYGRANEK